MWLSDAYILGIATLTVPNTAANNFKNIIIKNCGQFTNCICEINIQKGIMLKTLTQ